MNGHRINGCQRHRLLGSVRVFDFLVQIRTREHLHGRPANNFSYFRIEAIKISPEFSEIFLLTKMKVFPNTMARLTLVDI